LLKDRDGAGIQTLIPDDTTVASITSGSTSAAAALPAGASIVEVSASNFCYIAFGGSSVAATTTSRLCPPGRAVYRLPPGATNFAVLEIAATAALVTVTRLY
jgi:hypothetical protein